MTYVLTEERTGSGFKISFIRSGEAIPAYSLVYLNAAGRWMLADASAAASMPTVGLATETVVGGQLVTVLMIGATGTNAWAWTPGAEIYASETAGELTQTPPGVGAVNQVVAMAINASTIYFNASGFSSDSGVFVGDVDVAGTLAVDTINEHTALAGVTVEGVLLDSTTITIPSLTAGRVPYVGVGGLLTDDADFTYDGSLLSLAVQGNTGGILIGGDVQIYRSGANVLSLDAGDSFAATTFANITDSALTAGRVTFAGVGGLLTDDSDFTFATDTLTVTKTKTTELLLDFTQDYLFTEFPDLVGLAIQGRSTATPFGMGLFSRDGDGTDNVRFEIFGVGSPTNITNRERLQFLYTAGSQFEVVSEAQGTGTLRPLVLYTEGNTDQLKLNTDGTVSLSSGITATSVTDSGLTSGRVTFAGAGGLLSDDADLTFSGDTLTATKIAATTFTGNTTYSSANILLGTNKLQTTLHELFQISGADGLVISSRTSNGAGQLGISPNGTPGTGLFQSRFRLFKTDIELDAANYELLHMFTSNAHATFGSNFIILPMSGGTGTQRDLEIWQYRTGAGAAYQKLASFKTAAAADCYTEFYKTLQLDTNNKLQWRDSGIYAQSDADGDLLFVADDVIQFQAEGGVLMYDDNGNSILTIRSNTDNAYLYIDSNDDGLGGEESAIVFQDDRTSKWELFKNTDNTFKLYDFANTRDVWYVGTTAPYATRIRFGDKNGAADAGDFSFDPAAGAGMEGFVYDYSNGRLYWYGNGGVHYVTQDGGHAMGPEHPIDIETGKPWELGDIYAFKVDKFYDDGVAHGEPVSLNKLIEEKVEEKLRQLGLV